MPHRQVVLQVPSAPGADTAVAVGRDVVSTPAALHRAGEFFPVVQRKESIAGRMALPAVLHGLCEVCTAIPLSTPVGVWLKALIGVEETRPDTHETALVEREGECVAGRRRMNRLEREQIRFDRECIRI